MNGFKTGFGVGNAYDAYVAVIDTTQAGAAGLVYSTYLGGNGTDLGMGIAYAGNRIVYVTGEADTGFPTANALDASYNGGASDAFIAKIDTSQAGAASLLYSTFLGGSTTDSRLGHRRGSPGHRPPRGRDGLDRLPAGGRHLDPHQPEAAVRRQAERLGRDAAVLVLLRRRRQRQMGDGRRRQPGGRHLHRRLHQQPDHQSLGAGRLPDRQPAAGRLRRRRVGRLRIAHRQQRRPDPHQDRVAGARDDEQHGDLHADDRQSVQSIRRST